MNVQEPVLQVLKNVVRKTMDICFLTRDMENYECKSVSPFMNVTKGANVPMIVTTESFKKVAKSNYAYTAPIMDVVGESEP